MTAQTILMMPRTWGLHRVAILMVLLAAGCSSSRGGLPSSEGEGALTLKYSCIGHPDYTNVVTRDGDVTIESVQIADGEREHWTIYDRFNGTTLALEKKRESGRSKWSSLEEFDSFSLEPGKIYEGEVTETSQGRRTYWHYSIHVVQEQAITVPAGVFQTVQIEERRSRPGYSSTFQSYVNKGSNLVVRASYSDSDGTDNTCELVSASGG